MTRREFSILLMGAWNESSKAIIRALYTRPHRGERRAGKLAPTVAPKTTKVRRKGRAVATKNG